METPFHPGPHEVRPPSPQAPQDWRLQVIRKPDSVTVRVPVQRTPYRMVLDGAWTVIWAAAMAALAAAIVRADSPDWERLLPGRPVLIGLMILLGAAGTAVLLRFLWFAFGGESFVVSGGRLRVRHGIGPFGRWKE